MKAIVRRIERIPAWALSAIINCDFSGLSEGDIAIINKWIRESNYEDTLPPKEDCEPYFSLHPAFGIACEVYDCECVIYA